MLEGHARLPYTSWISSSPAGLWWLRVLLFNYLTCGLWWLSRHLQCTRCLLVPCSAWCWAGKRVRQLVSSCPYGLIFCWRGQVFGSKPEGSSVLAPEEGYWRACGASMAIEARQEGWCEASRVTSMAECLRLWKGESVKQVQKSTSPLLSPHWQKHHGGHLLPFQENLEQPCMNLSGQVLVHMPLEYNKNFLSLGKIWKS